MWNAHTQQSRAGENGGADLKGGKVSAGAAQQKPNNTVPRVESPHHHEVELPDGGVTSPYSAGPYPSAAGR